MRAIHFILCLGALSALAVGCWDDPVRAPEGAPMITSDEPAATVALGRNANPRIIPPQAHPHGQSYGEWSAGWWRWLWGAPADSNPGLDETGEFIDYGQSGSVWFIAPNYGGETTREATIPPGKMLFIDVAADFESPLLTPDLTEEELRANAAYVIDNIVSVGIEVDGTPVENLDLYRVVSPEPFNYTLPENNMFQLFGFDAPAGTYEGAVSDGYFVMLAPLPAGEHTIYIATEYGDPVYSTSLVTVNLTVSNHGD